MSSQEMVSVAPNAILSIRQFHLVALLVSSVPRITKFEQPLRDFEYSIVLGRVLPSLSTIFNDEVNFMANLGRNNSLFAVSCVKGGTKGVRDVMLIIQRQRTGDQRISNYAVIGSLISLQG